MKQKRLSPSLDIKGIKSENLIQTERQTKERLEKCSKKVIKLKCFSEVCREEGVSDTLHVPSKCYIRICPVCKIARQMRLVSKYNHLVNLMKYPRFMTLTLKGTYKLTKANKNKMDTVCQELFRELRNSGYSFSKYIKALEISKKDNNRYSFHYHVIYDGSFIPQSVLSDKWKKHSKGSFVVDIRKVYNRKHALFYISKYIAKAVDYDIPIPQYVRIRKMRFFNSCGFKGIKINKEIWAKCNYCGARMRYAGEYETDHVLKGCIRTNN
jgi:hypothetical protein